MLCYNIYPVYTEGGGLLKPPSFPGTDCNIYNAKKSINFLGLDHYQILSIYVCVRTDECVFVFVQISSVCLCSYR